MGQGNIIGKPNLPATTGSKGVWGMREQYAASRDSTWPGYDPQWVNTRLLLKTASVTADTFIDSSPNNFAVTRFGDTIQTTSTPYASYWSAFFDGSTAVTFAANAAFSPGTGNFTVEGWINPTTWGSAWAMLHVAQNNGVYVGSIGSNFVIRAAGVTDVLTTATLPTLNAWTHVVAVRSGTTMSLFFNGVRVATMTSAYDFVGTGPLIIGSGSGGTTTGNISNVRFVKGTAVYDPAQATLTVPTGPLTAVSGTSLLTVQDSRHRDNSTNNFAVTLTGTPAITRFSPFAWAWSAASGGSAFFDGTGDYLSIPSNTAVTFGTQDFCIEAWVNPENLNDWFIVCPTVTGGFFFGNGGGRLGFGRSNVAWDNGYGGGGVTLTINQWSHVAITRSGTTLRMFVNGTQAYSASNSMDYNITSPLNIGSGDANYYLRGSLANLRVVKGTAVYTANFTPPTAPVTAIANTSLLLNFTNAAYRDTSGVVSVMRTFGTPARGIIAPSPNLTSIAFNGSTDYLGWVGNNVMNFGSGDFTAQAWVRLNTMPTSDAWPTSYSSHMVVVECGTFNAGDGCAFIIGATKLIFHSNDTPYLSANHNMVINTWYHVAVRRTGNMLAFFVNGVLTGTTNFTGSVGTAGSTFVGCETGQGAFLNGLMSNLKVDRAVALRGTQGGVYFDGTGDFLSVPNAAANVTNQNYTAEAWVRFTVNNIGYQPVFGNTGTGDAHGWILITETNNFLYAYHSASGGAWNYNIATSYQPTVNVWTHLALVRNGTTVTLYANGVSIGSTSIGTNSVQSPSGAFYAGYYPWFPGGARSLTGNISNLRLVIGTAVYTSNFTPPTAPLTAIANTTLLTAQAIDSITDTSTAARTITRGGNASPVDLSPFNATQVFTPPTAPLTPDPTTTLLLDQTVDVWDATARNSLVSTGTIVATPNMFTGSALSLNGSQQARPYSSTLATDFAFGTADFTIEAWIFPTSSSGDRCIFSTRGNQAISVYFGLYTNAMTLGYYTAGAWALVSTVAVPINAWSHVALVRASGVAYFYINGVPAGSVANATNLTDSTANIGRSASDNAYGFIGQIDELRVTRAARYLGTFTPSSAPFDRDWEPLYNDTLVTSNVLQLESIGLGGATNNVFRDDSTNNFTPTRFGDTTQGSLSPYVPTGYWSNYFDGSGDYLSVPNNAAFSLGAPSGNANDFTVEFWAFPTSTAVMNPFGMTYSANNNWAFSLNKDDGNGNVVGMTNFFLTDSFRLQSAAGALRANKWSHIAVTRSGTTLRMFIDGMIVASGTSSIDPAPNGPLLIGRDTNLGRDYVGWLSNLRVVKGTAVYTSAFSPPTAPLTAISGTTFLSGQDNRFLDRSTNNLALTRFGDVSIARYSPFPFAVPVTTVATTNPGSVFFDGSGDYLSLNGGTPLTLGTGDFTIEVWINLAVTGGGLNIIDFRPTSTNGAYPDLYYNGTNIAYYVATGDMIVGTTVIQTNVWTHVALARQGTTTRLFVNGVLNGSFTDTTNYLCGASRPFIGGHGYLNNSSNSWNGSLSNLRVVKGTAVYTAAFTPPTGPLTAITNTSLLTAQDPVTVTDASTNNFTVTRVGDARATDFSPFSALPKRATYAYGGSGYFDGTGDYLSVPTNTALNFGTGDFCVEAWLMPDGQSTDWFIASSSASGGFFFGQNPAQSFGLGYGRNAVAWDYRVSNVATPGSWSHVAVTRSGTSIRMFINGTQVGVTQTSSQAYDIGATSLTIGSQGAGLFYKGHMANLRIVKGSAVYTANFTPATSPVTAISGTSLLLNFDNAGVYDGTGRRNLLTRGNAVTSTTQRKYDIASVEFNNTDGTAVAPVPAVSNDFVFGTGDFTIEFWVYRKTTAQEVLIDFRPTTTQGAYPTIYCEGATLYYYFNSGNQINGGTLNASQWFHIAVCRAASQTRLFVNGTQVGATIADTTSYICGAGRPLLSNGFRDGGNAEYRANSYIENLRISRVGRYTANFTVPSESFPVA